jgi:hypothetical protein
VAVVGSEDGPEVVKAWLGLVRRLKNVEGRHDARGADENRAEGPAAGVSFMTVSGWSSDVGAGRGETSLTVASASAALAAAIFWANFESGLLGAASRIGIEADEGCSESC